MTQFETKIVRLKQFILFHNSTEKFYRDISNNTIKYAANGMWN